MPFRNVSIPSRGTLGNAALQNLGADYYPAALILKSPAGQGVEWAPLWLPSDYDRSRNSALTVVVEPATAEADPVRDIFWRFQQTTVAPDGTLTDSTFDTLMTVPENWVEPIYWQIENPFSGLPMWEAHLLDDVRTVGFRMTRRGSEAGDTYPGSIRLGLGVEWDYPLRCHRNCC